MGQFDLQYVCTHLGEHQSGLRGLNEKAEVQHANSGESAHGCEGIAHVFADPASGQSRDL